MLFTVQGRAGYRKPLQRTLRRIAESVLLRKSGAWLDVAVRTIIIMEYSGLFYAGRASYCRWTSSEGHMRHER